MTSPKSAPPLSAAEARQIDQICDRFEAAWKTGERPDLNAYLGTFAEPVRSALLRQMLLLDLEYARRAGENRKPGDYHTRFPDDTAVIADVCREVVESADEIHASLNGAAPPNDSPTSLTR